MSVKVEGTDITVPAGIVADRPRQAFFTRLLPLLYFHSFQYPTLLDVDLNFIEGFHSQRKCPPCQFQIKVGVEREGEYETPPGIYMADCLPVIFWAENEYHSPVD